MARRYGPARRSWIRTLPQSSPMAMREMVDFTQKNASRARCCWGVRVAHALIAKVPPLSGLAHCLDLAPGLDPGITSAAATRLWLAKKCPPEKGGH